MQYAAITCRQCENGKENMRFAEITIIEQSCGMILRRLPVGISTRMNAFRKLHGLCTIQGFIISFPRQYFVFIIGLYHLEAAAIGKIQRTAPTTTTSSSTIDDMFCTDFKTLPAARLVI